MYMGSKGKTNKINKNNKTIKASKMNLSAVGDGVSHRDLNKALSEFVKRASKSAPKLSKIQNAYVNECSCFIISSISTLYPAFAAKISPSKLEHLLSKFLHAKNCSLSKRRMMGGSLALKAASISRKIARRGSLFPGILLLIYALFVGRASIEQLNQQNPMRQGRYEILDIMTHIDKDKEENIMLKITQENLMRWVTHPSTQFSEITTELSAKAIQIVGKVTVLHTERLKQEVNDHCLHLSSKQVPLEVPLEDPLEVYSRWSSFKRTMSGFATSAEQFVDNLAKVHLSATNLFDMPGCIRSVHDAKFEELMDQIKHEHRMLKIDIEQWAKKGENSIILVFNLLKTALGLILAGIGITFRSRKSATQRQSLKPIVNTPTRNSPTLIGETLNPILNTSTRNSPTLIGETLNPILNPSIRKRPTLTGRPYNLNENAIVVSEQSDNQLKPNQLAVQQLSTNQPYLGPIQGLQPGKSQIVPYTRPFEQSIAEKMAEIDKERQKHAIEEAQMRLSELVNPAAEEMERMTAERYARQQHIRAGLQAHEAEKKRKAENNASTKKKPKTPFRR